MRHLLFLFFISSLVTVSCASRKSTSSPVSTVESKPAPAVKDSAVTSKPAPKKESERSTCVIRLLLPLRLDEHFANDTVPDQPLLYDNAESALHFYLGALAAVDSLRALPVDVRVEVVDVAGDSLEVVNKLKNSAFKSADFALSMLPAQYNETAARAAAEAKCNLVLQGAANTQLLTRYPTTWLAAPANSTQLGMMSEYLLRESKAAEYIIFSRKVRGENVLASFMAGRIDSLSGKKATRIVEYNKDTWEETQKVFPKNRLVQIIIPTQDESYLQLILNNLNAIDSAAIFHLAGLPAWESFENLDPAQLSDYRTIIFNSLYVDTEQVAAHKFRKAFIEKNHADPMLQAYQAYDLMNYFIRNYSVQAKNVLQYTTQPAFELQKGLKFIPVCEGCGFENSTLNFLRYGGYKLTRTEFQR